MLQSQQMISNNLSTTIHKLSIEYKSAPNIALIKYWGKYDEEEILPINDSIGISLNSDDICTITTCQFGNDILEDQFKLNGKKVKIQKRLVHVLSQIKQIARKKEQFHSMKNYEWDEFHFIIQSTNNFPTASGMASSASGFSCLSAALNGLFGGILNTTQLSRFARWGSGSAARAVYEGLVKWQGVDEQYLNKEKVVGQQLEILSKKCISYSIKPSSELSYLKVMIIMTENTQKDISSTLGMRLSVETSSMIKLRNSIAKERIVLIETLMTEISEARQSGHKEREYQLFNSLAQIIMRDSNQFHAICLDTYPPIFYLNDFSRQIIYIIDNIINKQTKTCKVAYSFDAGAHAFLFIHEDMVKNVLTYLNNTFGMKKESLNQKAQDLLSEVSNVSSFSEYTKQKIRPNQIWLTDVGNGAEVVYKK